MWTCIRNCRTPRSIIQLVNLEMSRIDMAEFVWRYWPMKPAIAGNYSSIHVLGIYPTHLVLTLHKTIFFFFWERLSPFWDCGASNILIWFLYHLDLRLQQSAIFVVTGNKLEHRSNQLRLFSSCMLDDCTKTYDEDKEVTHLLICIGIF